MPVLEQLSSLIDAKFPPRHPAFLNGSAFFTKTVPLPPEVTDTDLPGFAELTLEEHSPFPMEKLRWGFLADRPRAQLFLYAAIERRLRALGHEDLSPSFHAVPDFLAALAGPTPGKPEIRLVCSGTNLSAVALEAAATAPSWVRTAHVPQPDKETPPTHDAIREAATALLRRLPDSPHALPASITLLLSAAATDSGLIELQICRLPLASGSGSEILNLKFEISGDTLWQADIRERDFLAAEKSARQRSDLFWKAILASLVVLALLIVSQISLWTARHILTRRAQTIEEQGKHVAKIDAKSNLLDKLRKATQDELKTFTMLSAIVGERPPSVVFNKVVTESGAIAISGTTKQISTFNKYTESIRKLPSVASITVPAITSQAGAEAPFTMTIRFKPGEPKEIKKDEPAEDPAKAPQDPTLEKKPADASAPTPEATPATPAAEQPAPTDPAPAE